VGKGITSLTQFVFVHLRRVRMNIQRKLLFVFCVVIGSVMMGSLAEAAPYRWYSSSYQKPHTVTYSRSHQVAGHSTSSSLADVRIDAAAYSFALREATLQASRHSVGHLLGIAPGCRGSGVGSSSSPSSPNHCVSGGQLVARAGVRGSDGKWYWSAHYR
jgi:hypothetical protein